jgi:hypothetical protein
MEPVVAGACGGVDTGQAYVPSGISQIARFEALQAWSDPMYQPSLRSLVGVLVNRLVLVRCT